MIQAMYGVKLIDRRNTKQLMDMLAIRMSLDRIAKASRMRGYGHVLKMET